MIFGQQYFGQYASGTSEGIPQPTDRTLTDGPTGRVHAIGSRGQTDTQGATGKTH